MEEIRKNMIALIKSVQDVALQETPGIRTHMVIGDDRYGTIWFGYGYFDGRNVMWWEPNSVSANKLGEHISVEQAVDRYLRNVEERQSCQQPKK